jgi:hypothetical protein
MTERGTKTLAKSTGTNPAQIKGTGTPAEDRESERVQDNLWDLKQDAKWGRDKETQKKAIQELGKNGLPALSHLEEILAVLPPGEIWQNCHDTIRSIVDSQPGKINT